MPSSPLFSDPPPSQPAQSEASAVTRNADGNLLVLLVAFLYCLLSLVSTNQTALWPWVVLWQAVLLLPIVWVLWQLWHKPVAQFRLGNGFDWLAGLGLIGLLLSTIAAEFSQLAMWYGIGVWGGLAALYGLMGWLTPQRVEWLLKGQGYLSLVFIVVSLGRWWWQIYRPELQRLEALSSYGLNEAFDFSVLGLRNWYPLGHQNYVAGYLVLVVPLLIGLALTDKTRQRWLWAIAVLLGIADLYTTNSRGGTLAVLGLLVALLVSIPFSGRVSRRIWLPASVVGAVLTGIFILINPRFRASLAALSQGNLQGGGVIYRVITNLIGWHMGTAQPWAGTGPGSVTGLFQRYRPWWAGREAELHYQLHSTPAQLWGELGIWGILIPSLGAVLLVVAVIRQRGRTETESGWRLPTAWRWSLLAGLWGYSILSLTDYQLDVIAITGVLIIFMAVLLFDLRSAVPGPAGLTVTPRQRRGIVLGGVGILLALIIWLIPLHRAWALSARGFIALEKGNLQAFVTDLQRSHELSPGEPYYPFMLGWVLGDADYQIEDEAISQSLRTEAVQWFEQANAVSPFHEFGHSNLGWLQLPDKPKAAIAQFAQSADLVPAKQGVFLGLGYSLLLDGQTDLAAAAIALEVLRHPGVITNLVLSSGELASLRPQVVDRADAIATPMLANADAPRLTRYLHQVRGTLRWWTGDLSGAAADWDTSREPISRAVLAIAQGDTPDLEALPNAPGKFALKAWQDPNQRRQWLETAWLAYDENLPQLSVTEVPVDQLDALVESMNDAETFDQWLQETTPYIRLRNERIGFGVLMRHDDGPSPSDFYIRWENLAMRRLFGRMLPSPAFLYPLETQLRPYQVELLQQVADNLD